MKRYSLHHIGNLLALRAAVFGKNGLLGTDFLSLVKAIINVESGEIEVAL